MQLKSKNALTLILTVALTAGTALPQDAAAKTVRLLGEVIVAGQSSLTIKPDAGAPSTVLIDEKTSYLRIPPGETDLKKAVKIELKDVSVGDRVLARSRVGEDQKPGPATSIIVMSKGDLAKKQETEKQEWQKRGLAGTITAIDPAAKEVTLNARVGRESKAVVVEASEKAQFRRYSQDSVRFSDAKPSGFGDLKVGDQMRVLGEKNADSTRIKPEMVVSGSFRNIAGTVATVDPASGEIKINNLETKKPLIVKVTADSTLKRIPAEMGPMLARMQQGSTVAAPGAPAAVSPSAGAAPPAARAGGRGGDFSQMVERMPVFALSELKPGDAIIVASSAGSDPGHITAITLLAGAEPLLTAPAGPAGNRQLNAAWNFDINIVQ